MNEDAKLFFDLERMYPEAAERVRILDDIRRSWVRIAGPVCARYSVPYDLGVNELVVMTDNDKAFDMLNKTKGNIIRILSSKYECIKRESFGIKIVRYFNDIRRLE